VTWGVFLPFGTHFGGLYGPGPGEQDDREVALNDAINPEYTKYRKKEIDTQDAVT
jgi:hypothetical protein